ncbi:hypothetical protein [Treponema sp.]|uniref:hypothetical protein n=1 Tax=Treponema sp. TaxID=166 RepID=UPI003FA2D57E
METKEKIERQSEEKFQELFGVKKAAFYLMLEVLERRNKVEHQKGGRGGKLTVMDRLEIFDLFDNYVFEQVDEF